MTCFEYWASQAPKGMFLCGLCYETKPVAEAWADEEGQKWDKCLDCAAREAEAVRRRDQDQC